MKHVLFLDPSVAAKRRGWTKTDGDDWNVYWANVYSVKQLFNPEVGFRLGDDQ